MKNLELSNTRYLFFSTKSIQCLLFLVLLTQLNTIVLSTFNYTSDYSFSFAMDTEEPKPKDAKSSFEFLEDNNFFIAEWSFIILFDRLILLPYFQETLFVNYLSAIDSPPPEFV